eukprot:TRINITY_DN28001_c0_g1_i1.p2 TRINITY_DN28001_c0_g1~~TRINITY_DN28001_c0_g1_i1.p2  ORF type:complete len:145 (+),score=31.32 TRINITY_DN28001_c0_g1_i1:63-497(+)
MNVLLLRQTKPAGCSICVRCMAIKTSKVPSLKDFMRKRQVLHSYRQLLKCARAMEDRPSGQEVAAQVRERYRAYAHETDSLKLRMLLAEAAQHIDTLQGTVARTSPDMPPPPGSWLDVDDPEDRRGRIGVGFPWQRPAAQEGKQ